MVRDMTSGSPMKLIVGFAVPIFLGNLFQQLYSVVDAMVLGRAAGADALAAAVWIPMNDAFHIREGRVRVDWDPLAERLTCAGQLALSLRIGQILWIGL